MTTPETVLVDGHVHLHPDFPIAAFLDAAAANFADGARALGLPAATPAMLLLADFGPGPAGFERLAEAGKAGAWALRSTGEAVSVVAERAAGVPIFAVAGRQIVSADGLEVLALGTVGRIPDGLATAETLARVAGHGALAVLPWGVGKWLGRRGAVIDRLVAATEPGTIFVADSGARLAGTPLPAALRRAAARGHVVLLGTDPLPLPAEIAKPARCGFAVDLALDPARPFGSLRTALVENRSGVSPFGSREAPWRFVANQFAMQLRKRSRAA